MLLYPSRKFGESQVGGRTGSCNDHDGLAGRTGHFSGTPKAVFSQLTSDVSPSVPLAGVYKYGARRVEDISDGIRWDVILVETFPRGQLLWLRTLIPEVQSMIYLVAISVARFTVSNSFGGHFATKTGQMPGPTVCRGLF